MRIGKANKIYAIEFPIHASAYYADGMQKPLSVKIRQLRKSLGKNQEDFALMFGVKQASVSRWETGSTPEPNALFRLAEMAGESIMEFLGEADGGQVAAAKLGPALKVVGEVEAGVFKDAWQWEPDDWLEFTGISSSVAAAKDRFGLRVRGESMNLIYPPGTILECEAYWGDYPIKSGKRVIVQRRRFNDGIETTVKELMIDSEGNSWLTPRSTNPDFQQPFRCDIPEEGIDEVVIIAVVVASIRQE